MRKYFVPVFVLLANALILSAADVTGTWKGTLTPENRDSGPALVILKQTGDMLTGTAGPNESERHEIANGKVTGGTVTFEVPREEGTMRFALTLEGDTLAGQVTRERDGQQQTAKVNLKREKQFGFRSRCSSASAPAIFFAPQLRPSSTPATSTAVRPSLRPAATPNANCLTNQRATRGWEP